MNNQKDKKVKEQYLKQIKIASRFGLIASIVVAAASILWIWLSPYTFRQNDTVHAYMMIAICVLAIATMAVTVLTVRNQFPKTRQLESVEARLQRYSILVGRIYYTTFVSIVLSCAMTILSGDHNMMMLVLVLTLTLFMAFPNMYRMKVDMGLTTAQARELWGDEYLPDEEEKAAENADIEEQEAEEIKDDEDKGK
jgi:ABC-type transport system involved in cytochrome bd biosynthesis fused ATPase/permease subunit